MANSQFLLTGTRVITVVLLTCSPNPLFIVAVVPLVGVFFKCREYFRRSARETQRLVAVTASPVFAALEETLDGLLTIRAYPLRPLTSLDASRELDSEWTVIYIRSERYGGELIGWRRYRAEGEVIDNFSAKIKLNSSFNWIKTSLDQWLLIRLCILGTVVVSGAALAVTLARDFANPTLVGLALSYAMTLIWDLVHTHFQSPYLLPAAEIARVLKLRATNRG